MAAAIDRLFLDGVLGATPDYREPAEAVRGAGFGAVFPTVAGEVVAGEKPLTTPEERTALLGGAVIVALWWAWKKGWL